MHDISEIDSLLERIKELRDSLPAHSIPPAMLLELEELEEKLDKVKSRSEGPRDATA